MIDFRKIKADRVGRKYNAVKAPHKAVLLLTVIKLYENNKIDLKKINFKDVYLYETYKDIWSFLNYEKPGPISNPLFHLRSDGFYTPHFTVEKPTKPGSSFKRLLEQCQTAEFNNEFITLLSDEKSRQKAITDILTGGFFTNDEIAKLNEKLNLIDKSFEYEKIIQDNINKKFNLKNFQIEYGKFEKIRNGSFRKIILDVYNSTCAVCKSSLLVGDTSIIDAAHILPFFKFGNDNPRNGIALCKNHHWLFDNGGISISPEYHIKISDNIVTEIPDKILSQFSKKKIMLPKDQKYYPAKEALIWHNQEWKFK